MRSHLTQVLLPTALAALLFAGTAVVPPAADAIGQWDYFGCYLDHDTGAEPTCDAAAQAKKDAWEAQVAENKRQWDIEHERVINQKVEVQETDPVTGKVTKATISIGNDFFKIAAKQVTGAVGVASGLSGLGQTMKAWKGGGALLGSIANGLKSIDPAYSWGGWPGHSQPFWEFEFTVEELACIKTAGCMQVRQWQIGTGESAELEQRFATAAADGTLWDLLHQDDRFRFYRDGEGRIKIAYRGVGAGVEELLGGKFKQLVTFERVTAFPAQPSAEVMPLGPQDIINNSPLLSAMQGCFKLTGENYRRCVDDIFRPPSSAINVDRYGLINPGPSGVYGQGWEEYGYTFDPTGVRGVPNPLVRVNVSGMGGSFSGQVFAPGNGLVNVNVGGSAINAPQQHEPRDCLGQFDSVLFPECGLRLPGPGVDPRTVTYPPDDVIGFARDRVRSPSSYSMFGTPNCSYTYTGQYNLKWTIDNPGCSDSSSLIRLEGGGTWMLFGLLTATQKAQAQAEANARQQAIVNQPRPDFPNDIPVSIYRKAWESHSKAVGTGYGSGSQLLGRDREFLFSLEKDGNVYCTKAGVYGSTVWCKQAIPLAALDVLYNDLFRSGTVAGGEDAGLAARYLRLSDAPAAAEAFRAAKADADRSQLKDNFGATTPFVVNGGDLQTTIRRSKAPDDIVAWAMARLTGPCVVAGGPRTDACLGTRQDRFGDTWAVDLKGVLTNRSAGKTWQLPVPASPGMAEAPLGALHSVLLQNAANSKVLAIGNSADPLMSALRSPAVGAAGAAQQWTLRPAAGAGAYKIVQQQTGRVLTPKAWSTAPGAQLIAWDDTDAAVQRWYVRPVGGDWQYGFKLVNQASGLVVTPDAWSGQDGNFMIQWHDTRGATAQVWQAQQMIALTGKASGLHAAVDTSNANTVARLAVSDLASATRRLFVRRVPDRQDAPLKFSRRLSVLAMTDGRVLGRGSGSDAVTAQAYQPDNDNQRWVIDYAADGSFKATSAVDGKALTAAGNGSGSALTIAAADGSARQQWFPSAETEVVNAQTGLVFAPSPTNADVVQGKSSDGARYTLTPAGDAGFYRIVNSQTGKILTPNAWSNAADTLIIGWDPATGDAERFKQQWALQPAAGGYRIVNRVSGLTVALKGGAIGAGTQLVAAQIDPNDRKQIWQIPGQVPHLDAATREVPVEVLERAMTASMNGTQTPLRDQRGTDWDFDVRDGYVTFSRRDRPLVNYSLKDPAAVINTSASDPGAPSTRDQAPFWRVGLNSGTIWLQDRSAGYTGCCVRTSLTEFALKHPEVELTTKWIALGQADITPGGNAGSLTIDGSVFKRGQIIGTDGARVQFRGRRFILRGTAGPGTGSFDVFLDGTQVGTVNAAQPATQPYSSEVADVPLFDSGNMPASWRTHTVEVRNRQGNVTISKLDYVPNDGA